MSLWWCNCRYTDSWDHGGGAVCSVRGIIDVVHGAGFDCGVHYAIGGGSM